MTVVRELLINFGAKLDDGSVREVDQKVKGMAGAAQAVMSTAFVFGVGKALLAVNELASNVEENMNVIRQSFGESSDAVLQWSDDFGDAAGRNKFELQEMASVIGATLNPLMEQNTEVAADMGMQLTQLAVDLGSFYNVADASAARALRSGLTGEAEPLKRFGIVMNEATLEAFALSQGIKGNVKDMGVAEKTALRYNFILQQTAAAQGDATRTADSFANAKKGLIGKLQEAATVAGMRVLPVFTWLINMGRKLVDGFMQLTEGTRFFESALLTLAAIAAVVGVKLLIAFMPVILPMLKLAAIFALLVIAVEDLWTFLEGGDSLIGRFIDSMFGPGSATAASVALRESLTELWTFMKEKLWPAIQEGAQALKPFLGAVAAAGEAVLKYLGEFVLVAWDYLRGFIDWILDDAIPGISKFINTITELVDKIKGAKTAGALSFEAGGSSLSGGVRAPKVSVPSLTGAGGQTITMNNNSTVNVNATNTGAGLADSVANSAASSLGDVNTRTLAALKQKVKK